MSTAILTAVMAALLAQDQPTGPKIVQTQPQPWLGVMLKQRRDAVVVTRVAAASPAAKAGVRSGDVLLRVGGAKVNSVSEAVKVINGLPVDSEVQLAILRNGKEREFGVNIAARPTPMRRFARPIPPTPYRTPWVSPYVIRPLPWNAPYPMYRYYAPGFHHIQWGPFGYWFYVPSFNIPVGPIGIPF